MERERDEGSVAERQRASELAITHISRATVDGEKGLAAFFFMGFAGRPVPCLCRLELVELAGVLDYGASSTASQSQERAATF
jgi:hypothetical protein